MFHFPSFASGTYGFSAGSRGFAAGGFPIRRCPGQSLLGGSPELIAACHVLHRLLTPGHPPCALIRLTTTQRMKNDSDAFPGSVVKEPGAQKNRALYRSFLQPIGCLPRLREGWLAIRSSEDPPRFAPPELRRASFALRAKDGGGERDRTDGLLVANQALSQLSYTPPIKKTAIFPAAGRSSLDRDAPRPALGHPRGPRG